MNLTQDNLRPVVIGAFNADNLHAFMKAALWDTYDIFHKNQLTDETEHYRHEQCINWCKAMGYFDMCAYLALNQDLNIIASVNNYECNFKTLRDDNNEVCYNNLLLLKRLILKNISSVALTFSIQDLKHYNKEHVNLICRINQDILNKISSHKLFILAATESNSVFCDGESVAFSDLLKEHRLSLPELTAIIKEKTQSYLDDCEDTGIGCAAPTEQELIDFINKHA